MNEGATLRNLWSRPAWKDHLDHYLAVFERVLLLLRQDGETPILEKELNRLLDLKLVDACVELDKRQRFFHPTLEAKNPSDPEFRETQTYEEKRPDFQWTHIDQSIPGAPVKRSFTVECKRLGKPINRRNLNKEYVTRGVIRFRHPGWRYGKDLSEGLMIGYIQSGEHNGIRAKIDETLRSEDIDELTCNDSEWKKAGVSRLEHRFTREFPVSPFRLTHFWLDLRRAAKGNP
uniref:Uncharacterized protein n=1 Tax=Candidatus Kentrum sp. LPFa TaxID=2126335 RepID=A0A450W4M1_9GAMM|nr:MAG: hypothetical protein BECKLPF1236A_GA0070988_100628 [Candidatus Kentron sp. LPFa]VFK27873.1 MAG: hypothetical protein BECKLPF1236C_GA0070990_1005410 [Candidatus Kentron sp. LPFa]